MEDRIVTGLHSRKDHRHPGARSSRIDFKTFPCKRNKPSSLLAATLLGGHSYR